MEKHHRRVFLLLRNTAVEQPPRQNNVGGGGAGEKQRESLVVGHLRVPLSHVVSVASFSPLTGSLVASWRDIRNDDERRAPSAARWTLGVCRGMMDASTRTIAGRPAGQQTTAATWLGFVCPDSRHRSAARLAEEDADHVRDDG